MQDDIWQESLLTWKHYLLTIELLNNYYGSYMFIVNVFEL